LEQGLDVRIEKYTKRKFEEICAIRVELEEYEKQGGGMGLKALMRWRGILRVFDPTEAV
jgi:hypothetical protein